MNGTFGRATVVTLAASATLLFTPMPDAEACGLMRVGISSKPTPAAVKGTVARIPEGRRVVTQQARTPVARSRPAEPLKTGPDAETREPVTTSETSDTKPVDTAPPEEATPPAEAAPRKTGSLKKVEIFFATGSDAVSSESEDDLASVVEWLKANPDGQIVIEGYADPAGSADLNQKLSVRRAQSVRDQILSATGVGVQQIEVVGFGESRLAYAKGSSKNRRVVIKAKK